jgi:hypothetical protein
VSLATLDSLDLILTSYSGFNYPGNAQVVALLGDGSTPGGNAVLQQSALTLRQASLGWVAEGAADVAAVRALYESKEEILFVDEDEETRLVRVLDFSANAHGGDLWDCTATLLETAEPGS